MRLLTFHIALIFVVIVSACTTDRHDGDPSDYETAIRGTAEILCDEQIADLLLPAKALYDEAYPDARITLKSVSSAEATNDLIDHRTRAIIIARDWLPSEDSLITSDEGEGGFPRTLIARDALVFFASKQFPLDTLNSEDIRAWLSGGVVDQAIYPSLRSKPVFVVPGSTSSVYGNIVNVVNKGIEPPPGSVSSLGGRDSVRAAVQSDPRLIGIGYLSQYHNDSSVKMLRLSYVDDKGQYHRPKPVHAAYVIQGKYPFPVPIYVVLRDKASNYSLPSGFMLYLARDPAAQRTFHEAGIEAGYAKYELILSE
jgi:ABC-type phosphate transport system substrate-binding protein